MKAMKHDNMSKDPKLSGENRTVNGNGGPYKGPRVQMVLLDVLSTYLLFAALPSPSIAYLVKQRPQRYP